MLQQLIGQAKVIEATQEGTKFAGAVQQVIKNLSVEDCEKLFIETDASARVMKNVERVRNNASGFSVWTLRDIAGAIILSSQIVR